MRGTRGDGGEGETKEQRGGLKLTCQSKCTKFRTQGNCSLHICFGDQQTFLLSYSLTNKGLSKNDMTKYNCYYRFRSNGVSRNFAFSARKTFNLRFPEQFLVNTASQAICLKMVKYCLSGRGMEVSLGNLFENYKNGKIASLWS